MTVELEHVRELLTSALVSDALDVLGLTKQVPHVDFRSLTGCRSLVGRARTTLWGELFHDDPAPYAKELQAVDECGAGEVLVCAAGGSLRSGIWGELLSTAARNRGCAGVLVDGAVRDIAKMTEMAFPVFARGVNPRDSLHRQRVTDVDVPVEIGGVTVAPGDLVVADIDGTAIVPKAVEAAVLERAWNKLHAENAVRDAIRGGMTARAAFDKYGVL